MFVGTSLSWDTWYGNGEWEPNCIIIISSFQCTLLFPKYCEPVDSGDSESILSTLWFLMLRWNREFFSCFHQLFIFCILVGEGEVRKLWRHIQPYFHSLMSRVFLRELSSTQFEMASSVQSASSSSTSAAAPVGVASSVGGVVSSLELPYYSKYLLLAAYIASYNPAKTDKRFFSKVSHSLLCAA